MLLSMKNYDLLQQELLDGCRQLRGQARQIALTIQLNGNPIGVERLNEMSASLELLTSFETLVTWFLDVVRQRGVETDRRLIYALKKNFYREFTHIRALVTQSWISPSSPVQILRPFASAITRQLDHFNMLDGRFLLMTGDHFEITRYFYRPDIFTLTIPTEVLNRPWQWSLFWHELGNLLIFPTKKKHPTIMKRDDVNGSIIDILVSRKREAMQNLPDEAVLNSVHSNKSFHLKNEETLRQQYANWLDELIEDMVVIFALQGVGWQTLADMLEEYYADMIVIDEKRHPPPYLRLLSAYRILKTFAVDSAQLQAVEDRWRRIQEDLPTLQNNITQGFDQIADVMVGVVRSLNAANLTILKPVEQTGSTIDPQAIVKDAYQNLFDPLYEDVSRFFTNEIGNDTGLSHETMAQLITRLDDGVSAVDTSQQIYHIAFYNFWDVLAASSLDYQITDTFLEGIPEYMLLPETDDLISSRILRRRGEKFEPDERFVNFIEVMTLSVDDPFRCKPCCKWGCKACKRPCK